MNDPDAIIDAERTRDDGEFGSATMWPGSCPVLGTGEDNGHALMEFEDILDREAFWNAVTYAFIPPEESEYLGPMWFPFGFQDDLEDGHVPEEQEEPSRGNSEDLTLTPLAILDISKIDGGQSVQRLLNAASFLGLVFLTIPIVLYDPDPTKSDDEVHAHQSRACNNGGRPNTRTYLKMILAVFQIRATSIIQPTPAIFISAGFAFGVLVTLIYRINKRNTFQRPFLLAAVAISIALSALSPCSYSTQINVVLPITTFVMLVMAQILWQLYKLKQRRRTGFQDEKLPFMFDRGLGSGYGKDRRVSEDNVTI